jgi:hypothetical protein
MSLPLLHKIAEWAIRRIIAKAGEGLELSAPTDTSSCVAAIDNTMRRGGGALTSARGVNFSLLEARLPDSIK